jgi:stalled ribosome alternative rescue factor ArfA
LYANGGIGVINGRSQKKERKVCEYLCSFMRRVEKRRTGKGHWKPERKKEFILYQHHDTLACIGIGNRKGVLQETKGESEDV